jgi:hypothetical protein
MTELTCVYSAVQPEFLNELHFQYLFLKCVVPLLLFLLVTAFPYKICAGQQNCIIYKIHALKMGTITYRIEDGYHTLCVFVVTVFIVKMMVNSIIL